MFILGVLVSVIGTYLNYVAIENSDRMLEILSVMIIQTGTILVML